MLTASGGRSEAVAMKFNAVVQWGVAKCGFDKLWGTLDVQGKDPGCIGLIDNGSHRGHRELVDRIADGNYVGPENGTASIADHASSVAAIISAQRGEAVPSTRCRPRRSRPRLRCR